MSLLDRVATFLAGGGIRHALIGAAALAVHGVSRSTVDDDLLVVDSRVLDTPFWQPLKSEAQIRITRGDDADPLAGVVRIHRAGENQVDVVVGRYRWQQEILARAVSVGTTPLCVVRPEDLILLKLYAGGSRDKWDIEQLLAVNVDDGTVAAVDDRVDAGQPRALASPASEAVSVAMFFYA